MKHPALPSKITSLFAFIGFVFLAAAVILTLLALLFTSQSHAAMISTSGINASSLQPFGIGNDGMAIYTGRFEQIYRPTMFPAASWITQIAFQDASMVPPGDLTYTLSIALGVTPRTFAVPGTGFAEGATHEEKLHGEMSNE